jgi:hypothetical protein
VVEQADGVLAFVARQVDSMKGPERSVDYDLDV